MESFGQTKSMQNPQPGKRPVFARDLSTIIEGQLAHSSDKDDRLLFRSFKDQTYDPRFASVILYTKHNCRNVTRLTVRSAHNLEKRAWARLGDILGQNTNVKIVSLLYCSNLDMAELCFGV